MVDDLARVPRGVAWTSLLTVFVRAAEDKRPDALFSDDLASEFIRIARKKEAYQERDWELPLNFDERHPPTSELWEFLLAYIACRTPFYDATVMRSLGEGACQIVIVAAGMDTRAERLELDDQATVFEIDVADVQDYKRSILERSAPASSARRLVTADLRGDWRPVLTASGYDPDKRSVWVIEGLLMYLDEEECETLLVDIREIMAPGSRIALEYYGTSPTVDSIEPESSDEKVFIDGVMAQIEPGPALPPRELFARHGLQVEEEHDLAEYISRSGRDVPRVMSASAKSEPVRLWLAAASYGGQRPDRASATSHSDIGRAS